MRREAAVKMTRVGSPERVSFHFKKKAKKFQEIFSIYNHAERNITLWDCSQHINVNGYHFRGNSSAIFICCLPFQKGLSLKGKNLLL